MKRKIRSFPKARLLIAGLFLFFIGHLQQSCTKLDTDSGEFKQDPAEKFFTVPAGTEPQVLRIIDNLQQQNRLTGFIKDIAIKEGYPVWNKIISTLKPKVTTNFTGSSPSVPDTILYIPLVLENTQYVNSFIYARLNGTVHLRLYRGREYNLQGYNPARTDNAEKLALQIMKLDNEVFGSKNFIIHDSRLFRESTTDTTLAENKHRKMTLSVSGVNSLAGGNNFHWEDQITTTCTFHWGYNDDPIHSGIYITQGWQISCTQTVVSFLVEDDDNPDFPPSGGGNGGGGSSGNPPSGPQQCNPTPLLDNGLPPCEHGDHTGWEIGDLVLETPCEKAARLANDADSLYVNGKVDSMMNTIPNFATQVNEYGFGIIAKFRVNPMVPTDTTIIGYKPDMMHMGDTNSIAYNVNIGYLQFQAGAAHTHPPKDAAPPSAFDVYNLIEHRLDNNRYNVAFINAANGSKYALTISDWPQAAAFELTKPLWLDIAKWREDMPIGKSFQAAKEYYLKMYKNDPNKDNLAFEMAMAAVLKEYNTGITLNKQDAADNFKPVIINTTIPNPNKPNKKVYTQDCL